MIDRFKKFISKYKSSPKHSIKIDDVIDSFYPVMDDDRIKCSLNKNTNFKIVNASFSLDYYEVGLVHHRFEQLPYFIFDPQDITIRLEFNTDDISIDEVLEYLFDTEERIKNYGGIVSYYLDKNLKHPNLVNTHKVLNFKKTDLSFSKLKRILSVEKEYSIGKTSFEEWINIYVRIKNIENIDF
jgi:hypothetical protein